MGTLFATGWESSLLTEASGNNTGTISVQSSVKRTGGYALRANPTTTGTGWTRIGTSQDNGSIGTGNIPTTYARFYLYIQTAPASNDELFAAFLDGNPAIKLGLRLNSARKIVAYDSTGTLLGTGATVLALNTWYRIEAKCGTGASAAWEVKIDGVSELSGSTANLTVNGNASFCLGKYANNNGQSVDFYYDDFLWSDVGYPGAGQIVALKPAANGTYQAYTIGAGSGSHYQIVNEVPPDGDTSYLLSTGVAGNAETEQVQTRAAAGISPSSVNTVVALFSIKRDGGSNGGSFIRLRSNTTNGDKASNMQSPSTQVTRSTPYDTDPATSAAWLPAALDTIEIGLIENSTNKTRLSAAYLFVDYVPAVNTAPTVNAGADQTITLPASAVLDATVTDDGLPGGTLTYSWTKVSGPGTVTFADSTAVDTTASFSVDGVYVLRLTADDGALTGSDDIQITVNPPAVSIAALKSNFGDGSC